MVTDVGLPLALWAMDRLADFAPAEVGVNVTVTACAAPPALIVNEAGLTVNIAASDPETVMPVTLRAAPPRLVTLKVAVPEEPEVTLPALTVRKKGDQEAWSSYELVVSRVWLDPSEFIE